MSEFQKVKSKRGKLSLADWNLPRLEKRLDEQKRLALIGAEEVIAFLFRNESQFSLPAAFFPTDGCAIGGETPAPKNSLTIEFSLSEDGPSARTTINEIFRYYIETCEEDGSYAEGLEIMAPALEALADRVRRAVAIGKKHEQARIEA